MMLSGGALEALRTKALLVYGRQAASQEPGKRLAIHRPAPGKQRAAFHVRRFNRKIVTCVLWNELEKIEGLSSEDSPAASDGNGGGRTKHRLGYGGGDGDDDGNGPRWEKFCKLLVIGLCGGVFLVSKQALAHVLNSEADNDETVATVSNTKISENAIWQVKDGKWIRYVVEDGKNELVMEAVKPSEEEAMAYERQCLHSGNNEDKAYHDRSLASRRRIEGVDQIVNSCLDVLKTTMLPIGYPKTVSEDYTEYTLWRMGQVIASQISGVLTTQALLYAVGLGKGAIPTAAAINWVLKDGIGYLSKIVLSTYGRHFDVHPKGWRLLSDLMEDAANGLELLTPAFPHLFVPLTAIAGAGKSASGLIQAATRSCFYAGFATQQNFAEVIAKGEAQGMLSKSLGIAMGIGVSSKVGSSGPLLVIAFTAVTAAHILCNLKSYQAVQLHTLNPYRTGLIMAEYLNTQRIPSVRDVNSVEPILMLNSLSSNGSEPSIWDDSKGAALDIERNLHLGVRFGDVVTNSSEGERLFELYQHERYMLAYQNGIYKVVLKESASPYDMLRAVVQASYLRHVQRVQSTPSKDAASYDLLRISYESMHQNFNELMERFKAAGWSTQGLVSRPASNRLLSKKDGS